jgi:hypothetical protein
LENKKTGPKGIPWAVCSPKIGKKGKIYIIEDDFVKEEGEKSRK